ncbi:DUF2231 domain-containing protein [Kallotenue papyrolyticum]|uniref:DUF2231 domain-containing protein n=1 Tax=Kallotenue papyrolyticum TaxID=1325125 RepID=UPI00047111B3|nr:DUF2231 domain-containing protein [Kallotenue papyrolyticum]
MASLPAPLETLKKVLQGRGLVGHPLHVALNHVPLGLWEGAVVFDLLAQRRRSTAFSQAGYYLNLWAVAMALPTALTGLAEWLDLPRDHPAWKTATAHGVLNDLALNIGLYNWLSRRSRHGFMPDRTNLWLDGALLAILGLSGYLGGVVAHEYGYGTHRQGAAVAMQAHSLVGLPPEGRTPAEQAAAAIEAASGTAQERSGSGI